VTHAQGSAAAACSQESPARRGATDPTYLPTILPTYLPANGSAREAESRADSVHASSFNSFRTDVDSPQLMRARQSRMSREPFGRTSSDFRKVGVRDCAWPTYSLTSTQFPICLLTYLLIPTLSEGARGQRSAEGVPFGYPHHTSPTIPLTLNLSVTHAPNPSPGPKRRP
jgi:hypothetical protein